MTTEAPARNRGLPNINGGTTHEYLCMALVYDPAKVWIETTSTWHEFTRRSERRQLPEKDNYGRRSEP